LKIEQNKTTRVEDAVSDDRGPEISPRRKNHSSIKMPSVAVIAMPSGFWYACAAPKSAPLQNTSAD
jgi:hypothetical protein